MPRQAAIKPQYRALRRKQLSDTLLLAPPQAGSPSKGWIREIREALGISAMQMSKWMGMSPQAYIHQESSERKGTLSLARLRRIAGVLGFHVVITLVPRGGGDLDTVLRTRARQVAERLVYEVERSMGLESQARDAATIEREIAERTEELIRTADSLIWEGEAPGDGD